MKLIGIILIALQILAVLGSLLTDGLPTDFFTLLGYFLPGIIGGILLIKSRKKNITKKHTNENDTSDNANP